MNQSPAGIRIISRITLEDSIQEATIRYHIAHKPNGIESLEANRRLARLLRHAQAKYPKVPPTPFNESQTTEKAFSRTAIISLKLAQLESSRIDGERRLREAVISVCEQSAQTLREPTDQNNRTLSQKIDDLNALINQFHRLIGRLSSQFDLLEMEGHSSSAAAIAVPYAFYSDTELTLLAAETQLLLTTKSGERTFQQQQQMLMESTLMPTTSVGTQISKEKFSLGSSLKTKPKLDSNQNKNDLPQGIHLQPPYYYPHFVNYVIGKICNYLVPLESYKFRGTFGRGAQGTVHKAKKLVSSRLSGDSFSNVETVALKVAEIGQQNYQEVVNEVVFTSARVLTHAHILTADGCSLFRLGSDFFAALQFQAMEDGCLAAYVHARWPERCIASVMRQLLLGTEYIHSKGVIHNDIKPANILLHSGTVKLADFGRALQPPRYHCNKKGTIRYMAPEMADAWLRNDTSNRLLTAAADIWALGITLYELIEGVYEFASDNPREVMQTILKRDPDLSESANYSVTMREFFSRIAKVNPEERPSAGCLLDDPFLADASTSYQLDVFIKKTKLAKY